MSDIQRGSIVRTKSPVYFNKYTDKGELRRILTRDSGEIGEVQEIQEILDGIVIVAFDKPDFYFLTNISYYDKDELELISRGRRY